MGQYVALKLQSLLDVLHLEHILSNKNMYMQKIKVDQAQKWNNMTFYLLQNTRNLQHIMHAISDSRCNVTRSAQERQHSSCRVDLLLFLTCFNIDFSVAVWFQALLQFSNIQCVHKVTWGKAFLHFMLFLGCLMG